MTFTKKEKQAIASILSAIIYADGKVDGAEVDYLARLSYELEISSEDGLAGLEMEPSEAMETVSLMDADKKKEVEKILLKMVYADKELSAAEYELVAGIALKCGLMLDE